MSKKMKFILIFGIVILSLGYQSLYPNEVVYKILFFGNQIGFEKYSGKIKGKEMIMDIYSKMTFKRANTLVQIEQKGVFVEDNNSRPMKFEFHKIEDDKHILIKGRVEEETLLIEKEGKEKRIPLEKDFVFYNSLKTLIRKKIKNNEREFSYSFYSPEFGRLIKVENTIVQREKNYVKIKSLHANAPGVTIFEKRNIEGALLEQEIPGLKVKKIMVETNKIPVMQNIYDIYRFNAINTENRSKNFSENESKAFYKIIFDKRIELPESSRQKIINQRGNEIYIKVVKGSIPTSAQSSPGMNSVKKFLENNEFLQLNNPSIAKILEKIPKDDDSPRQLVEEIHKWTLENIKTNGLSMNFADVPVILEKREGDCSEFSVLSVALLRAGGIASRVCFGVIYINRLFRYHFWIEYYDKGWTPFDPISRNGEIDVGYIKFADLELNNRTKVELGLELSKFLSIRKIEIIDNNCEM